MALCVAVALSGLAPMIHASAFSAKSAHAWSGYVVSGATFTSIFGPPQAGIEVTQVTMKNGESVLSACALAARSSAAQPPANIACKWSGAQ